MTLALRTYVLGQLQNNLYLLADPQTNQAVLIDPPMDTAKMITELSTNDWQLSEIWITHAHFDHILGLLELKAVLGVLPPIRLHPEDLKLYQSGGLAGTFGIALDDLPLVQADLTDGMMLSLGEHRFTVHHTPGHTPGHVIIHSEELGAAFVGDLIFRRSVGRTDFPGADHHTLIHSIHRHILTLDPKTRLLSGHGQETTVDEESRLNPFLF